MPVLELAIDFTGQRHLVIANNIANVSTPKYKTLDLPVGQFQEALGRAVADMESSRVRLLKFEGTQNVKIGAGSKLTPRVVESKETGMLRHNENNVSIELEMVKLAKNTGLHNALKEVLAHQFSLLDAAIRGTKG